MAELGYHPWKAMAFYEQRTLQLSGKVIQQNQIAGACYLAGEAREGRKQGRPAAFARASGRRGVANRAELKQAVERAAPARSDPPVPALVPIA